jgi:hypothetical protein
MESTRSQWNLMNYGFFSKALSMFGLWIMSNFQKNLIGWFFQQINVFWRIYWNKLIRIKSIMRQVSIGLLHLKGHVDGIVDGDDGSPERRFLSEIWVIWWKEDHFMWEDVIFFQTAVRNRFRKSLPHKINSSILPKLSRVYTKDERKIPSKLKHSFRIISGKQAVTFMRDWPDGDQRPDWA